MSFETRLRVSSMLSMTGRAEVTASCNSCEQKMGSVLAFKKCLLINRATLLKESTFGFIPLKGSGGQSRQNYFRGSSGDRQASTHHLSARFHEPQEKPICRREKSH